jgi:hypothetical protein
MTLPGAAGLKWLTLRISVSQLIGTLIIALLCTVISIKNTVFLTIQLTQSQLDALRPFIERKAFLLDRLQPAEGKTSLRDTFRELNSDDQLIDFINRLDVIMTARDHDHSEGVVNAIHRNEHELRIRLVHYQVNARYLNALYNQPVYRLVLTLFPTPTPLRVPTISVSMPLLTV